MTRPGDGWFCVAVTGALLALALVLELTGPPRPLEFSVRLPALILVFGASWAATRRRWGAGHGGPPVPMATPALVMSSMLATAAVTAKLVVISPGLAAAVLLTAAACCCMAAVGCLASRVPRQAVRPVGVDA